MKESRIAQPAAQPGDVIAHYRLVERLGRDNDTTIYRAKDLTLDRDVAVKVLSPEHAASATALERFRREAHIASLVTHPHICAVHDSGEENGHAFLVCELLEGRGLDAVLAGGALGPDRMNAIRWRQPTARTSRSRTPETSAACAAAVAHNEPRK